MTSISPRTARAVRVFMTASVIALTTAAARADEPPPSWLAKPPPAAPAPAQEPARFPWRASLLIAVSAALGGAAVWVRSHRRGLTKLTSSRELRVISSVRVGPKGHLVLAGIGDRAILLGVTDQAVRRIAWMPADQIVNGADVVVPTAPADDAAFVNTTLSPAGRRAERTSTAIVTAPAAASGASESGLGPALRRAPAGRPAGKGGFADILRKIGGRNVDAPPEEEELSPAATLAELRRDSVQWSRGASNAVHAASASADNVGVPAAAGAPSAPGGDFSPELEQQAAGILKRRSRGKRA